MNQQPDKIFRDKLEHHQRPVSADAWSRIEAQLDKKEKPAALWWKIAAALLIVAISLWIFIPKKAGHDVVPTVAESSNPAIDKNNSPDKKHATENDNVEKNEIPDPTNVNGRNNSNKIASNASEKKFNRHQQKSTTSKLNSDSPSSEKSSPVVTPPSPNSEVKNTYAEVSRLNENKGPGVVADVTQNKENKNMKIYVSASDTDKYLKKVAPAEATSDDEKSSRLKRLLDKADDLALNQDPLGEIRQRKNEILALNFKNEKGREQNR